MASHNPFRTPVATPNSTGSTYAPPPNPPPTQRYAPPTTPRPPDRDPDPMGLSEDVPPAYTSGPDFRQGESTIEYGPARPFQPAPPPLLQQQNSGFAPPPPPQQQQAAPSLWQQLTGASSSSGSGGWAQAYPGRQQYAPPPQHPQMQAPQPPQPPTTHISEFARDFYATTSVPPGGFSDVSGARGGAPSPAGYPPPPPPPSQSPYQPPPGAPPRSPGGGAGVPDDGRPTSTPIPGHPLLRGGSMLVYPPHYECSKCNNTGYKHADPSRPCAKCWEKYARPYAGALVHAPAPGEGAAGAGLGAGHASSTFQRPLPRIYAPPVPPPGVNQFAPPGAYPPPPGNVNGNGNAYPPPPAAIYPPGDARLGGMPCWRCSGRGTVSFLVFETVPCGACRGVGRVFA
ncbi:hypothetical protein FB451DRAFT_1168248 [Mycena latifolia]|nr:hypothetical protein FB451DRAFT_1168248 [Mycena latifolia]